MARRGLIAVGVLAVLGLFGVFALASMAVQGASCRRYPRPPAERRWPSPHAWGGGTGAHRCAD